MNGHEIFVVDDKESRCRRCGLLFRTAFVLGKVEGTRQELEACDPKQRAAFEVSQELLPQMFTCKAPGCGKLSVVRDIDWQDGAHFVRCQACGERHDIVQSSNDPPRFTVLGPRSPPRP